MEVQSSERQSVLKKRAAKFWSAKNSLNEVFWLRDLQNFGSYRTPEYIYLYSPIQS